MTALQILVAVGLLVAYQWPFGPQSHTGRAYDPVLVGFVLLLACLALALLLGGVNALLRDLKNRWRSHR